MATLLKLIKIYITVLGENKRYVQYEINLSLVEENQFLKG